MLRSAKIKDVRLLPLLTAALLAASCSEPEPELPVAPAPDEDFVCTQESLLSLLSWEPDSSLQVAPWIEVCTSCAATSMRLDLRAPDGELVDLQRAWSRQRQCAVALASEPLPPAEGFDLALTLSDGTGEARLALDLALSAERGPTPDPGPATWVLPGDWREALAVPAGAGPALFGDQQRPPLVLHLDGADGLWEASLGLADGDAQDRCAPTVELAGAFATRASQLGGPLQAGDHLPGLPALPFRDGALQAHLDPDGSLRDVALLAHLDAAAAAADQDIAVEEFCAELVDVDGSSLCGPCEEPWAGASGPAWCVTAVLEWPVGVPASGDRLGGWFEPVSVGDAGCVR